MANQKPNRISEEPILSSGLDMANILIAEGTMIIVRFLANHIIVKKL